MKVSLDQTHRWRRLISRLLFGERRRARLCLLAPLIVGLGVLLVSAAGAQPSASTASTALTPFSKEEIDELNEGKSVRRKFFIEVDRRRYRAGLAYRLIEARPLDVMRALRSKEGIARAIPYGVNATTLIEKDGVATVRIRQGKPPIVGEYTVRMKWEANAYRARFWMDPSHDHDLKDIWGAFVAREVKPGWTLVSFAVAFDLGGVGEILASKAHRWSLSTADRIARLVEERRNSGRLSP